MFCPGANWDQGLYPTAAYFYSYNYALALKLPGIPPARGVRAKGLRELADELHEQPLVVDVVAVAHREDQVRHRAVGHLQSRAASAPSLLAQGAPSLRAHSSHASL